MLRVLQAYPLPGLADPLAWLEMKTSSHLMFRELMQYSHGVLTCANTVGRSMRHPKRGSKETGKLRRPSESAGLSTSNNWRRPSELMSKT